MALVFGVCEPLWIQSAFQDQLKEQKLKYKVSIVA